jgi:hypothetical protein
MTSSPRRRLTAVLAATMLMTAGLPAVAHAADHARPHRHPPHASTAPDRVAYVQRPVATTSSVPQRTAST